MRHGVFVKLLAAFLLVIVIGMVTVDIVIQRTWEDSLRREIERGLVGKAQLFAHTVETNKTLPLQQLVNDAAAAAEARATVIDSSGRVLADSSADSATMENHATRPEFISALAGRTGSSTRLSRTVGIPFLYVAVPTRGGAVRFAYSLSSIQHDLSSVRRSLLLASTVALVFASLLAALLARRVSQRLSRLAAFAQKITSGDLNARIADLSTDELAAVTAALDQTARKLQLTFDSLQNSRDEMETLLNSIQEAVIAVSSDGKVLWANDLMRTLAPAAAKTGSPVIESVRDPSFLAALNGALHRNEVCRTRISSLALGRVFELTAAPMATAGAVMVLRDVTESERVEKTRRDFIANVSHELRTPLTSIQGYAETLIESVPANADPTHRDFLEIILKNATRMTRLTSDLLVLARVESGEERYNFVPVRADELLAEAVHSSRHQAEMAGMELGCDNTTSVLVLADRDAIHRVFANLIANAIKYGLGGKRVVVGAREAAQQVEFFVRDFGPGISSQHHSRLFERFYRVDKARSRDAGGTGLGLAIVKHIVQAHAGQVRVESELGHGATFFFSLPLANCQPAPSGDVESLPAAGRVSID